MKTSAARIAMLADRRQTAFYEGNLRMIWATRRVHRDVVRTIALLFRDQVASFDPDDRMLLVSVDEAWPDVRLWVAVPDVALLTSYYGFELCPRADLPAAPTLVAGSRARFGAIFHDA